MCCQGTLSPAIVAFSFLLRASILSGSGFLSAPKAALRTVFSKSVASGGCGASPEDRLCGFPLCVDVPGKAHTSSASLSGTRGASSSDANASGVVAPSGAASPSPSTFFRLRSPPSFF